MLVSQLSDKVEQGNSIEYFSSSDDGYYPSQIAFTIRYIWSPNPHEAPRKTNMYMVCRVLLWDYMNCTVNELPNVHTEALPWENCAYVSKM